jgi:NAD(P)H-hydrate repair Nnr-like enzyme with NAD(P)H-hydrate dehydratase domain
MRDIAYVVELAKSYDRAEITRDALQDKIHSIPLSLVQLGVTAFGEEFGDQAAAGFVVAAELPTIIDADGLWSINEGDDRARDFPPE